MEKGRKLGELLAEEGLEYLLCDTSLDWRASAGRWIEECSHFMAVPGKSASGEIPSCLDFFSGYCLGSGKVLVLTGSMDLPENLSHLTRVKTVKELRLVWSVHHNEWKAAEVVRNAIEALMAAGHGRRADDFIKTVTSGELRIVNLFLRAGLSPDTRDMQGVPVLSLAVRSKHGAVVKLLLSRGASIDAVSDDRGNTALMDAAAEGMKSIVIRLIKAGANIDQKSKNGQTALILAVGQKNFRIAELLIEAGADLHIKDALGMSARDYAKLFKEDELLSFIDAHSGGESIEA